MRARRYASLLSVLLLSAAGCDKPPEETTPPAEDSAPAADATASADACTTGDPADDMLHTVLDALASENKDEMMALADGELGAALTDAAFADLSKVMSSLGSFQSCAPLGEGKYQLGFAEGEVEARLTVQDGKVHGMYFGGDAFAQAEHSVLGDAELVFKVYDFRFVDETGEPNPGGEVYEPGRQHFIVVVGGFETDEGDHDVTIRKKVTDADGKVVYDSPEEIDLTFASALTNVRTSMVLKYVDIDKPGKYHVELTLEDKVSGTTTSYEDDFEVTAASK